MPMGEGVKAADMCLKILEHVAFSEDRRSVTQIAESVGLAKSAAFKHLQTLMEHGMVVQDLTTLHYQLGPKAWLIGQQAQTLNDISGIALPYMLAARNETRLAVVLTVPTRTSAYVLLTCPSTHQIEIGVRAGSHLALHASAQGKVFLAFGDPQLLQELSAQSLPPVTPFTISTREALTQEISKVRSDGYAAAPQEALLGVNAMAAPLFNYTGELVGSIGFVGSVQHLPDKPDPAAVGRLLSLTKDVSAALGAR